MVRMLIVLMIALSFAPSEASATSKSLFIQLNKVYSEPQIRAWLGAACDDSTIVNLVIQDAGYSDGTLRVQQLEIVEDYFHCFNAVFFGVSHKTHEEWKDWPRAPDGDTSNDNAGTQYDAGIKSASFRAANIGLAKATADLIAARYPALPFHWYISHEANLNYLTDPGIRSGFKDYLSQVSGYLYGKKPRSILWSPAFWTPYASLNTGQREELRSSLTDLFKTSPRVNRLEFQDFIGQASTVTCLNDGSWPRTNCLPWQPVEYAIDCTNTRGYYGLLQDVQSRTGTIVNLMVNMEMFITQRDADGKVIGFIPGDPVELQAREECYEQNGIPIGASWEARYWYLVNHGIPHVEVKYP